MEREVFSKIIRPHAMTTRVEVLCDKQGEKMMTTDYTAAMDTQPLATVAAAQAQPPTYRMDVRFTGSGSEYFRIWIVNVLLLLVTLGLYWPWAKARRLRYFYANTVVGEHPLVFHGQGSSMFKGYAFVMAFVVVSSIAQKQGEVAAMAATGAFLALWPWLLCVSLRFRLGNTSWQGVRFGFKGTPKGAYATFVLVAVFAAVLFVLGDVVVRRFRWHFGDAMEMVKFIYGVWAVCALLVLPAWYYQVKKYQHAHYAWGDVQTRFDGSLGLFYRVLLRFAVAFSIGVALLLLINAKEWKTVVFFGWVGLLIALLVYPPVLLYNFVWSHTVADGLRFEARMRPGLLAARYALNALLLPLTLGLYWPFAVVALARLRLESVTVFTEWDPAETIAQAMPRRGEAVGEAAADLLGVDFGM